MEGFTEHDFFNNRVRHWIGEQPNLTGGIGPNRQMFIHSQWPGQFRIYFVAGNRTGIHRNDGAAALRPETGLARPVDHEFIPIPILARGSHDGGNGWVWQFADALENVPDLRVFEFQLARVSDVLILAAGTLGVKFTARRNPVGGGGDDPHEVGRREPFADIDDLDLDTFAWDDKRNEDHKVIETTDAIAAKGDGVDIEFEALSRLKGWQSHGLVLPVCSKRYKLLTSDQTNAARKTSDPPKPNHNIRPG